MFEGNKCPYCGKVFLTTDDIVVCPECGTPHHRSCYKEHDSCANQEKHGEFIWTPDKRDSSNTSTTVFPIDLNNPKDNEVVCRFCGQVNKQFSKYCSKCGNILENSNNGLFSIKEPVKTIEIEQVSANAKIDGIPIKDWLVYLGPTSPNFIRTYLKQNNNNSKFGFSLGAFFFPVLYYLYYRIWDIAAIIIVLDVICNAPTIMLQFKYPIASMIGMSAAQFSKIADILSYTYLALILIISLFAKTIVRYKSSKKIKKIRRSCTNEIEYNSLLAKKSCPNKILVSIIIVFYIISFLFLLFT